MNTLEPVRTCVDPILWDEAVKSVNLWRGEAVYCFAEAETAVSETILLLRSLSLGDQQLRLPHLIGQRYEVLASAIGEGGSFAKEGAKAAAALSDFRKHERLRAFLCHGTAKVTLDKHGKWLALLKVLSFEKGREESRSEVYEENEAATILAQLRKTSRQLRATLQSLRARLAANQGPAERTQLVISRRDPT